MIDKDRLDRFCWDDGDLVIVKKAPRKRKIEKDGKTFDVRENEKSWSVRRTVDILTIQYNIPKTECVTFEELSEYIAENDLF